MEVYTCEIESDIHRDYKWYSSRLYFTFIIEKNWRSQRCLILFFAKFSDAVSILVEHTFAVFDFNNTLSARVVHVYICSIFILSDMRVKLKYVSLCVCNERLVNDLVLLLIDSNTAKCVCVCEAGISHYHTCKHMNTDTHLCSPRVISIPFSIYWSLVIDVSNIHYPHLQFYSYEVCHHHTGLPKMFGCLNLSQ